MAVPVVTRTGEEPPQVAYDELITGGRLQLQQWRLEDAAAALKAALRLRPCEPAAHYLLGEALFLQRRLDAALACHAAAVRHGIDRADAGRGPAMSGMMPGDFAWMSHMLRGDFAAAWRLADHDRKMRRHAGSTAADWPRHQRPVWDGGALDGRRVLVRCYHGFGDTIQFIRYAPLLARRTASVCVEAQPELLGLLEDLPGIDRLRPLDDRDRDCRELDCDTEIDVTELPHAFRTTLANIPASVPYLQADPAHAAAARCRLAPLAGRRKVGLCWMAGGWRPERSIAPDRLAPLGAAPGVAFVSLQLGPAEELAQRAGLAIAAGLISDEIAETAALVAGLDLVVTVDTMVAHLAGALGRPVWLLLHAAADWRWLLDRADSPWYPTMRLFRQPSPGEWNSVVRDVGAALSERAPVYGA